MIPVKLNDYRDLVNFEIAIVDYRDYLNYQDILDNFTDDGGHLIIMGCEGGLEKIIRVEITETDLFLYVNAISQQPPSGSITLVSQGEEAYVYRMMRGAGITTFSGLGPGAIFIEEVYLLVFG